MLRDSKKKLKEDYSIIAEDSVYYLYYGEDVVFSTRKSEVAQAWIEKYDINRMIFN